MATYTENYNLLVTEPEDNFDIQDYNVNFEAIDTLMAENESAVQEMNGKIGTSEAGNTLFSLLEGGSSPIKSIQKVTYTIQQNSTTGSIAIASVNPNKCIVLFERLHDPYTTGKMVYTLNATSISLEHNEYNVAGIRENLYGFWIIEFN